MTEHERMVLTNLADTFRERYPVTAGLLDSIVNRLPVLHITCETRSNGIIGSTDLPVIRVGANDDGSFTAVTDYWPQAHVDRLASARQSIRGVAEQWHLGKQITDSQLVVLNTIADLLPP